MSKYFPDQNIKELIHFIGDDPDRDGLKETPNRVLRSYSELFSGYHTTDADIDRMLTQFDTDGYDQMVILHEVEFTSFCEHHLLPFEGHASIGYLPYEGKVVGISKLARVLDVYARRLQIQERLTTQIAKAIHESQLKPLGVGCVIVAKHDCMICRGVRKQNSKMITSELLGSFRTDPAVRAEFFSLIRSK